MSVLFEKDGVRVEKYTIRQNRNTTREELFVVYDGHDLGVFGIDRLTVAIDWAILVASKPKKERRYWLH